MAENLIKFANNSWSKIIALVMLPISIYLLVKQSESIAEGISAFLGLSSLTTLGTALFVNEKWINDLPA